MSHEDEIRTRLEEHSLDVREENSKTYESSLENRKKEFSKLEEENFNQRGKILQLEAEIERVRGWFKLLETNGPDNDADIVYVYPLMIKRVLHPEELED